MFKVLRSLLAIAVFAAMIGPVQAQIAGPTKVTPRLRVTIGDLAVETGDIIYADEIKGEPNASGAGDNHIISGSDSTASVGTGGNLTIRSGNPGTAGAGGKLTLKGADSNGTHPGGDVEIYGGDVDAAGVNGGRVWIKSGVNQAGADGVVIDTSASSTPVADVIIKTGGITRLDIAGTGSWSLGSDGVGTAGHVLTSNGSGTPPTWEPASGLTQTTGQFTLSWEVACTTTPTQVVNYVKTGQQVTWDVTQDVSCTSDSTEFRTSAADVPASIRPSREMYFPVTHNTDNGTVVSGCFKIHSNGTVALYTLSSSNCTGAWSNIGTKAWTTSTHSSQFTYRVP